MDSTLGSDSLEPEKRTTIDSEGLNHRNPERFEGENRLSPDLEAQGIEKKLWLLIRPVSHYTSSRFFLLKMKKESLFMVRSSLVHMSSCYQHI